MKISPVMKRNNSTKRKNRPKYKPKILWDQLGIAAPETMEVATPIETIRKDVSLVAMYGLTNSRAKAQKQKGHDQKRGLGERPSQGGSSKD